MQQLLPPQPRQSLETGTGTSIIALPFSLSSARTSVRISPNRLRPLHCERFRALGLEAPSPMPHSRSLGAASTSVRGCVARRVSSNLGFCQNCNNRETGRGRTNERTNDCSFINEGKGISTIYFFSSSPRRDRGRHRAARVTLRRGRGGGWGGQTQREKILYLRG